MEGSKQPSSPSSPSKSPDKPSVESTSKAGSVSCPYKLVVVGGGPSGCSVIVRAVRIGLLSDLFGFTFDEPSSPSKTNSATKRPAFGGVCLVDSGTKERFGGGSLQDYAINSNTYVNKFVSHLTEEKLDNLPPERIKGTVLEKLAKLVSAQELERYGNHTGPLKKVGNFLRDVGSLISSLFASFPESSHCFHETTVQSLHRIVDKDGKFQKWKIIMSSNNTSAADSAPIEIYSKHVVLCTGGHQSLPSFSPQLKSKLVTSDYACSYEGIKEIRSRLQKNSSNPTGNGRIVIIGGSHSAFSVAWVCLQKLLEGLDDNHVRSTITPVNAPSSSHHGNNSNNNSDPYAKLKFGPSGICILHRSPIKVFYSTKGEADHDHYNEGIVLNKITGQINPFGGLRGDAKELWRSIRSSRETRVRLLQVKGNIGIASSPALNNTQSFGGMKQSIVDKLLDEAVVIVWACGYNTNIMPIYDANNQLLPLSTFKGQVNVDEQARMLADDGYRLCQYPNSTNLYVSSTSIDLMTSPKASTATGGKHGHSNSWNNMIIDNLYGSGLGYGLKATLDNGELDGSSGRADGVAVYLKRGATLVLAHIFGNKVFGGIGIKSWEERNLMIQRQKQTQLQLLQQEQQQLMSSTPTTASSTLTSLTLTGSLSPGKSLVSPKRPSTTANGRSVSRSSFRGDRSGSTLSSSSNPITPNSVSGNSTFFGSNSNGGKSQYGKSPNSSLSQLIVSPASNRNNTKKIDNRSSSTPRQQQRPQTTQNRNGIRKIVIQLDKAMATSMVVDKGSASGGSKPIVILGEKAKESVLPLLNSDNNSSGSPSKTVKQTPPRSATSPVPASKQVSTITLSPFPEIGTPNKDGSAAHEDPSSGSRRNSNNNSPQKQSIIYNISTSTLLLASPNKDTLDRKKSKEKLIIVSPPVSARNKENHFIPKSNSTTPTTSPMKSSPVVSGIMKSPHSPVPSFPALAAFSERTSVV
jgi:hypothetical protein